MNVKLYGFTLTPGTMPLADLFAYLKTIEGEPQEYRKLDRIIHLADSGDAWVGLLLTIRDHKKYVELQKTSEGLKIKVNSINDNNRLVDFNFFAVSKDTGSGIYQHYPNSFGMGLFGFYLADKTETLARAKMNAELEAAEGAADSGKRRRAIRKKYKKKRLKCAALLKPEDFNKLVDDMSDIKSFSFDMTTLSAKEPWLVPAKSEIAKEHHSVRFVKKGVMPTIKSMIFGASTNKDLDQISVSGLDMTGDSVTYHLGRNLDTFGKLDFDSIADDTALDVKNILTSPIVDEILQAMDDNPRYFQKVPKP